MNRTHANNLRSARDEAVMSRLLFRNGDTPALPLVRQPDAARTLGGFWPDSPPGIEDIAMLDKQLKPANWRSGPLARLRATLTTAAVLTAVRGSPAGRAGAGRVKDHTRLEAAPGFSARKD